MKDNELKAEKIDLTPSWTAATRIYIECIAHQGTMGDSSEARKDLLRLANQHDLLTSELDAERKKFDNMVENQQRLLLSLRERSEKLMQPLADNKTYQYERAKFIGMLDVLQAYGMNTDEFNWIY